MKKITLLVTAICLMGSAVNASEKIPFSVKNRAPVNIYDAEPIVFTERGIEFFVFADGQFDFNTRPSTASGAYYKKAGRNAVNATFGAPGLAQNTNYGVLVEHDNFGRVRRVGNVFINYDHQDRIKRIGSVYMNYNRFALSQVGGLQIGYNNRGQIIGMSGSVNGRRNMGYAQNTYQSAQYNSPNTASNEDYYYYKTEDTKIKTEDNKVAVRR